MTTKTKTKETLFTEDQLDRLLATDSIAEQDKLINELEDRIDYIIRQAIFKVFKTDGWWAWEYYEDEYVDPEFSNKVINRKNGVLDIYFAPDKGRWSEYIYKGETWGVGDGGFPLEWLWTDNIKEIFAKCLKEAKDAEQTEKEKAKIRREEIKEAKKKFRESAMKKLTAEEKWACGLSKKFPKTI